VFEPVAEYGRGKLQKKLNTAGTQSILSLTLRPGTFYIQGVPEKETAQV